MKAQQAAAVAALEATWNAAQVHDVGSVPASPTTPYAVVSVDSGTPGNYRAAQHGSKAYRIAVQCFGKDVSEVGFAVEKAESAFLDKRLTITGYDATPCATEVSSPIYRDPDAGVLLLSTLTFTFSAYPTA